MERIELNSPTTDDVQGWEQDFLHDIREQNWLGKPPHSVEFHLLDVTRLPKAESVTRLRDRASDLHLLAFFTDKEKGTVRDYIGDEAFAQDISDLNAEFHEVPTDMSVYLNSIYELLPEDVRVSEYLQSADVTGMNYNLDAAEEFERELMASDDFIPGDAEISAEYSAEDAVQGFEDFLDCISVKLSFDYIGHRDDLSYSDASDVGGRIYFDGDRTEVDLYVPESADVGDELDIWVENRLNRVWGEKI